MKIGDFCYRMNGVAYFSPPHRVRLPDGTTRTDPSQWTNDPAVVSAIGWEESTVTQEDIDRLNELRPPLTPLEQGYETPEGWRLGWQPDDVALLTGLYVLAQRAAQLGIEQPIIVTDTAGVGHQLTFAEFDSLMLGYGAARAAMSGNAARPGNVAI